MKQLSRLVTKYWLWICTEPVHRTILGIHISNERYMFLAENFIRSLHLHIWQTYMYTDGGTWDPQISNFLYLNHNLHFSLEKSLIESNAILQ